MVISDLQEEKDDEAVVGLMAENAGERFLYFCHVFTVQLWLYGLRFSAVAMNVLYLLSHCSFPDFFRHIGFHSSLHSRKKDPKDFYLADFR